MSRWLNRFQPWGVLLLRLVLGVAVMILGYRRIVAFGGFHGGGALGALQRYAHNVATFRSPHWFGYVSAFLEFAGGILLTVGLFTRFFAFLIAFNLLVAIATVARHDGYAGSEYAVALSAMAIMLLLAGPGKAALDRKMGFS